MYLNYKEGLAIALLYDIKYFERLDSKTPHSIFVFQTGIAEEFQFIVPKYFTGKHAN
jgi:hypothetical protein